jgi:protein TonB
VPAPVSVAIVTSPSLAPVAPAGAAPAQSSGAASGGVDGATANGGGAAASGGAGTSRGEGSGGTAASGKGSALALAAPGGGDAAEYSGYLALVRSRIQESLTYPTSARRRGLTGTVQVDLAIDTTGAVSHVSLAASSSHRVLDDAALDAVRNVERVPFPSGLRPRRLRVRLPVVFDLR